ncbi:MAG: N-acetylglucosamine-6-phosphate deacetylase [Candidatus Hydrogenedentes bacterium]|nr:N-acetylglucosamine-6-phosphate deacetylase [Candidatus Hydrogenedentota bacterium]
MDVLLRGKLLGTTAPVDVRVRDGRVVFVKRASRATPELGDGEAVIAPPLFDIQVNGAGGVDLQSPTLSVEDVLEVDAVMRTGGVAHWVPTLVTGPLELMERNCRVIAAAIEGRGLARAVPGIHLEGPVISPEDGPRGAHPRAHVRPPSLHDFNRLFRAANGRILYTTTAPDQPRVAPYIKALRARGVVVSLGHHNASADQIAAAVDAGAQLCTHLGNGAAPVLPRHHNPIWPQLAEDRLMASFIADGHHLPDPVLKTLARVKGPRRSILASDCVPLMGMSPGRYDLFGTAVELRSDGRVCLSGTDLLAGSATPLISDVLHTARVTDFTLEESFQCARENPARLFGLRLSPWKPQAGRPANFLLLSGGSIRFQRPETRTPIAVYIHGKDVSS